MPVLANRTPVMEQLTTDDAPAPLGPYSQGIVDGDRIFVSGQGPIDPETGDVVDGDAGDQAAQVLENAAAILDAGGASLDDVVKTTVFLTDMGDYDAVNEVYAEYMSDPFPARSCVAVRDLPGGIDVEIELIARVP
jgi:2-iminobutanoate/2-iminopropanoate deaminase